MIRIPIDISSKTNLLIGNHCLISNRPTFIFAPRRIEFLSELSKELFRNPIVRNLPDVTTFAYWSRSSNLKRLSDSELKAGDFKVGLGLSYHICPSNVPINFAYSLAFGLLSGNTCALRLPSKKSVSIDVLVEAIRTVLQNETFSELRDEIHISKYERDDDINKFWIYVADCRIIWGGDSTINSFRKFQSPPKSREVAFPDRYSFCILNAKSINNIEDKDLDNLCYNLYNDIYLMDQAACSSPQLLSWLGSASEINAAKSRLWKSFLDVVKQKYDLKPIHAVDKYVNACQTALNDNVKSVIIDSNYFYRIELLELVGNIHNFRAYFGSVHEVNVESIEQLGAYITERFQTLTYYGVDPGVLKNFIISERLRGIDRVVPVGKAVDMGLVWDGYNVISTLTRQIEIQ